MKFTGTDNYVATEELQMAVNAAVALQRPLLIKGEPGTGKTLLAEEVAKALDMPLLSWHIKSTTKAQQGLYEYDAVSRLRDSQLGSDKVQDIRNYIDKGKLWEAFTADEQVVLLIDFKSTKLILNFPTICYLNWIVWSFTSMRRVRPSRRCSGRLLSLPVTTKKNCRMPFCVDVFSTLLTSLIA